MSSLMRLAQIPRIWQPMVLKAPAVTSRDMYYIHFLANLAATEGDLLSNVCP